MIHLNFFKITLINLNNSYFAKTLVYLCLILGVTSGCTTTNSVSGQGKPLNFNELKHLEVGKASYYAEKFVGKSTANGEHYQHDLLTAAHPTLPFGSLLLVKRRSNKKYVVVRINDRGPFFKGRNLDLSQEAAKQLGIIKCGIAKVDVYLIPPASNFAALL